MLAIVDPVCKQPYSKRSLDAGALGGTEATVIRIAEGLDAQVFQHNRVVGEGRYRSLTQLDAPSVIVVLRDAEAALQIASQHPGVPMFVWMHDLVWPGTRTADALSKHQAALAARGVTLVAVSNYHRDQIESVLGAGAGNAPRVVRLYNPLRPGLTPPDRAEVDPDQLIYFSSPYKGLGYALWLFKAIHRRWPSMRLLVANPGYFEDFYHLEEGVVALGSLAQSVVLEQVSRSLCTFMPNFEYPETFGLVLAESNAVGTPVLGHSIGAADEVCQDHEQVFQPPWLASTAFLACHRVGRGYATASRALDAVGAFNLYIERLSRWRDGARPTPRCRPEFELQQVLEQWKTVLPRFT